MDTIKARHGYRVCRIKDDSRLFDIVSWKFDEMEMNRLRAVLDGDTVIMIACLVSMGDYKSEREQNEMFHFCERFTTCKGNHYIYWRDEETDTDYITKEV